MNKLTIALINKGYDTEEAQDVINNMREAILEGEDPEELLYDEGLEADYVMDLLNF
jgi:hypothetical protein